MTGAIYTRYSTELQTENSTETQVNACLDFASKNNISIIKIYSDEETTGVYTENRKKYQDLLTDANTHLFDCVLIYDITRGSRNVVDWFEFRQRMKLLNIQVISINEKLGDLYDPNNFLTELITVGMGQHFVLQTRIKSIAGKRTKAQHGLFMGGYAPLGYDIIDQKYVINEKEATVVKEIYRLYNEGNTLRNILKTISKYNIVGKRGKPLKITSLYSILTNIRYTGTYVWMENICKEMHIYVGKKSNNPVIIENIIPTIIDKNTFMLAQNRMKNKKIKGKNKCKNFYLLSNLIRCGECGQILYGITKTNSKGIKTVSYICSGKFKDHLCNLDNIPATQLENFVKETILQWIKTVEPTKISSIISQDIKSSNNDNSFSKLNKINKEITNITNAIKNGISYNELMDEYNILREKKLKIEDEIKKKNALMLNKKNLQNVIISILQTEKQNINNNNVEQFIKKFIKEIVIYKDGALEIVIGIPTTNSNAPVVNVIGCGS